MYGQFISTEQISVYYPDNESEMRKHYNVSKQKLISCNRRKKYKYKTSYETSTLPSEEDEKYILRPREEVMNAIGEVFIIVSLLIYHVASSVFPLP